MSHMSSIDPAKRQVLVNLGNRFVVFGPSGGLPEPLRFRPEDTAILPRLADESDAAEVRIIDTLQVHGMTRGTREPQGPAVDLELIDSAGKHVLVEVKVRERDPKQRDLQLAREQVDAIKSTGKDLEVWFFNTEKLKLTMMGHGEKGLRIDHLVPLNVWEKTSQGTFERQRVVQEVEDWLRRIEQLYANVQDWLRDVRDLKFEQTRHVIMSEEMMHEFAVMERELAILDVIRDNEVVISFVPRGLWLIGAWGRIDLISKNRTTTLIAIKKDDSYEWRLAEQYNRRETRIFDKSALLELMSGQ